MTIVHIARGEHFNPLPPHGGRLLSVFPVHTPTNFNPLPPHGGRRVGFVSSSRSCTFQSTPSAWRETELIFLETKNRLFQSTPSAWRETKHCAVLDCRFMAFQSTPSAWRETYEIALIVSVHAISIHSLRMEGDRSHCMSRIVPGYFNPLPPHGGRRSLPLA